MPPLWLACVAACIVGASSTGPYISTTGPVAAVEWTSFACGVVCTLACAFLAWQHFGHYAWPEMQRVFIRLFLMPPSICLSSSLIILWPGLYDYFDCIIAFTQPIVYHSFISFIIIIIGGEQAVADCLAMRGDVGMQRTCCLFLLSCKCVPRYHNGVHALHSYKWRVAQFCFLRPLLSLLKLFLHRTQGPSSITLALAMVGMVSAITANTSVAVLEKKLLTDDLRGVGVTRKFWAIRIAILLLIIQGQIINMTANFTSWDATFGAKVYDDFTSVDAMQRTLQFVVLIEMLLIVTPLFLSSFALYKSRHILARNPSREAVDPHNVNAASCSEVLGCVFLAWIDCAGFIWTSLFCGWHDHLDASKPVGDETLENDIDGEPIGDEDLSPMEGTQAVNPTTKEAPCPGQSRRGVIPTKELEQVELAITEPANSS